MEIPASLISKEALDQLIEDFILREGTDYGQSEYSLDQKKQQILKQLASKHVYISYDNETESSTLIKRS